MYICTYTHAYIQICIYVYALYVCIQWKQYGKLSTKKWLHRPAMLQFQVFNVCTFYSGYMLVFHSHLHFTTFTIT
jgi:hypothetical protein